MCVQEAIDQTYHQKFVRGMQDFEPTQLAVTPGDRERLSQASDTPAPPATRLF